MKNNVITDERILLERRKIQSTGYSWIINILIVAIIIEKLFLNAEFKEYAVELFILIGAGLYNTIAHYKSGIDIWNSQDSGKGKILINALAMGAISLMLFIFISGNRNIVDLVCYFVIVSFSYFLGRTLMIHINRKRQQDINREIIDDNDDIE